MPRKICEILGDVSGKARAERALGFTAHRKIAQSHNSWFFTWSILEEKRYPLLAVSRHITHTLMAYSALEVLSWYPDCISSVSLRSRRFCWGVRASERASERASGQAGKPPVRIRGLLNCRSLLSHYDFFWQPVDSFRSWIQLTQQIREKIVIWNLSSPGFKSFAWKRQLAPAAENQSK